VRRWASSTVSGLLHEDTLKVADFGLSVLLADNVTAVEDVSMVLTAQPIGWLAPELIRKKPLKSSQSDVYAFAVMMWEVPFRSVLLF